MKKNMKNDEKVNMWSFKSHTDEKAIQKIINIAVKIKVDTYMCNVNSKNYVVRTNESNARFTEKVLKIIKNPTDTVKIALMVFDKGCYRYFKNQSQMLSEIFLMDREPAIEKYPIILKVEELVNLYIFRKIYREFDYLKISDRQSIQSISAQNEKLQLIAVKNSLMEICYMKNPSEKVQKIVIENAPGAGIPYSNPKIVGLWANNVYSKNEMYFANHPKILAQTLNYMRYHPEITEYMTEDVYSYLQLYTEAIK